MKMETTHWFFTGIGLIAIVGIVFCGLARHNSRKELELRNRRCVTPECGGRETYKD